MGIVSLEEKGVVNVRGWDSCRGTHRGKGEQVLKDIRSNRAGSPLSSQLEILMHFRQVAKNAIPLRCLRCQVCDCRR